MAAAGRRAALRQEQHREAMRGARGTSPQICLLPERSENSPDRSSVQPSYQRETDNICFVSLERNLRGKKEPADGTHRGQLRASDSAFSRRDSTARSSRLRCLRTTPQRHRYLLFPICLHGKFFSSRLRKCGGRKARLKNETRVQRRASNTRTIRFQMEGRHLSFIQKMYWI